MGRRGWLVTLGLWGLGMGLCLVGVTWRVRIAAKRWTLKTYCYLIYLTELGVLQLPLPPAGDVSQHWVNGGAHGYPLFRTVRKMMVVVMGLKHACKYCYFASKVGKCFLFHFWHIGKNNPFLVSFMARCSKFPDMGIDGVNFDPEKEICGGRKISEEQRYIISRVKKIFFKK